MLEDMVDFFVNRIRNKKNARNHYVARVLRYLLVVGCELVPILNQNKIRKTNHTSQLSILNFQLSTD